MKDEGVSRVGIVAAINFAGNDDANRGLLLFHSADLHGRSVGAKKQRAGGALRQVQIKGVHVVADGMKFGNVEGLEIVVRRFDFRAFDHGEPDGEENVFDGLEDLADQVVRTDRADDPGEREVGAFTRERGFFGAALDGRAARFDLGLHVRAQCV